MKSCVWKKDTRRIDVPENEQELLVNEAVEQKRQNMTRCKDWCKSYRMNWRLLSHRTDDTISACGFERVSATRWTEQKQKIENVDRASTSRRRPDE